MRNMISWKLRRTVKSVPFYLMFGASLFVVLLFIPFASDDGVQTAMELLLQTLSRLASVFDLFAGLYAALCLTHDVQNRFVSAAVMTGNSIFSVVISEFVGFAFAVFVSVLVPSLVAFFIGLGIFGFGGMSIATVLGAILYAALYAFVCVAAFGITVPICFIIRGEGLSCIVNLIVLITLWSLVQEVIETAVGTLIEYTSFGQLFFLCSGDFSACPIIKALSVGFITIALLLLISYSVLKNKELK